VEFIILALATWRVSSLLASERGPWGVLERLRAWAGVRYRDGQVGADPEFGKWLICAWCSSITLGVAAAILYWLLDDIAIWLALPFALSAIACILSEVLPWRTQV